jgi:hypothetical protein
MSRHLAERDCEAARVPASGSASLFALHQAVWCGAALTLLTACGEVPGEASLSPPEPVIQMLLVAGAPQQVASVEYSTPAESVVAAVARPIAAESVSLFLGAAGKVPDPLQPVPDVPGRFVVDLSVEPETAYRLAGSVLGTAIEAEVTVPGPLTVFQPASDTLRLSSGGAQIQYRWRAAGAVAYGVELSEDGRSWDTEVVRDTAGALGVSPPVINRPDTTELRIWAYDEVATAFFLTLSGIRPRAGNIRGALGAFGAATLADPPKVIIWQ